MALAHTGIGKTRPAPMPLPLPGSRNDPTLLVPANDWHETRLPAGLASLHCLSGALAAPPAEPLEAGRMIRATPRRWTAALVMSCVLHAAVAFSFVELADEDALIAGAEQAQVALLGNAPDDQLSAGDGPEATGPEVTNVTIVTMLAAEPVEIIETETVEADAVATVVPVEATEMDRPTELAEPIRPSQAEAVPPDAAAPVETPEAASSPATERSEPTDTAVAATTPAPEVLVAQHVEAKDDNVVAPVVPPTVEKADTAEPVQTKQTAEVVDATAQAAVVPPSETVQALAEPEPKPAAKAPPKREQPKPTAKPAKPAPKAKAEKPVAAKKDAKIASAGSGGRGKTDAKRGEADGRADGKAAAKSKGGQQSTAAGNASVTNYPGKIVSKLRRALRYPAEAKRKKLRGEVQVSFTVSASGSIGAVRVVRSSGSPVLDKAAIETVRRAAPFPPIPDSAGRPSWPFSVPLAFNR